MDKLKTILKTTSIYGWLSLIFPILIILSNTSLLFSIISVIYLLMETCIIIHGEYYNKNKFKNPNEEELASVVYEKTNYKILFQTIIFSIIFLVLATLINLPNLYIAIVKWLVILQVVVRYTLNYLNMRKLEKNFKNNKNSL